jgi:hypothetical protein
LIKRTALLVKKKNSSGRRPGLGPIDVGPIRFINMQIGVDSICVTSENDLEGNGAYHGIDCG